jgi:Pyruvate/2-oxoacid:ferredoxin oxidoreductase gamma subunit
VKIASSPAHLRAQRIATGEADLVLGCDMLTAGAQDAISKMRPGRTLAVINLHQHPPGTFAQDADWQYPVAEVRALIAESAGAPAHDNADFIDATKLATALMGDSIAANLFMLGYAWQKGRIPLTEAALLRAIELNGVAVASNKKSFLWGRRAAFDLKRVEKVATPLFAKKDAKGQLVKAEFGSWMMGAFKLLAKMKGLRGGAFDVFGYTAERKMERALIAEYRQLVEALLPGLTAANHATAVELASLPEYIRGFGHVKEKAVAEYRVKQAARRNFTEIKRAA